MVSVITVTMEEFVMMRQGDVSVLQDSWEQTVSQDVVVTSLVIPVSSSVTMKVTLIVLEDSFVCWIHMAVHVTLDIRT
ncbi:hypothetical protein HOLleu_15000 [Holothuria leucospilota]|uniref:Uncharacterized protein n=1 Tax=Holothuria leucospilota TaxID=206669 RepID=A0A9Q1H9B6_HOLLE|nr:hypothetical protein HOLleu_15000 [Holothuria leucospilota]